MEKKSISEVLYKFGETTIKLLTDSIEQNKETATRKLRQSVDFHVKILGSEFVWTLVMEDYWRWVEAGREAGKMPPIEPLIKWLRFKGIKADLSKRRNRLIKSTKDKAAKKTLKRMSQEKAQRGLAWAIAKSIAKKGTIKRFGYEGSEFYSKVMTPDYLADFRNDLQKALKRDVQIEIHNLFDKEL